MRRSKVFRNRARWAALLAAAVALASCSDGPSESSSDPSSTPAVEFAEGLQWFNTGGRPVSLEELRGSVVLLHFWSAGCVDCLHTLTDLERLQARFGAGLQVVGVHVPRFPYEAEPNAVRYAVLRNHIMHPVVSDPESTNSSRWGVESQPTIVVIDATGNAVGTWVGDGVGDGLEPLIGDLVDDVDEAGDPDALEISLEGAGDPETVLSFPSGVAIDADGSRAFVADTGHHRIVEVSLPDGEVRMVYGSGVPDLRDGAEPAFHSPHGVDVSDDGATLFVADTGNHAVRVIDLTNGETTTVAGTGALGSWPPEGGPAPETALRSPSDVAVSGDELFVTMAGSHQIWRLTDDLATAEPFVGSGVDGAADGADASAELARPGGLALGDGVAWFADPEASTLRRVDLETSAVTTVAGPVGTLFETGDANGVGPAARFQFPLGVAVLATGDLVVADTYNSRLRRVDAETSEVTDVAGAEVGWQDGPEPLFAQPEAVAVIGDTVYVADTGNHVLRLFDLDSGEASTVVLKGIETFAPPPDDEDFRGTIVEMESVTVAAGPGTATVDISLPPDHKVNQEAPSSLSWWSDGAITELPARPVSLTGATFPVSYPVSFVAGSGTATADIDLFWCDVDAEQLCFIEQLRLIAPFDVADEVADDVADELRLTHELTLPGG